MGVSAAELLIGAGRSAALRVYGRDRTLRAYVDGWVNCALLSSLRTTCVAVVLQARSLFDWNGLVGGACPTDDGPVADCHHIGL
jgi:hypothetical protein